MDCSLPGSSVHAILQARTLEWVAIPFSRQSSQLRDWNQVTCMAGGLFTIWATRETNIPDYPVKKINPVIWKPGVLQSMGVAKSQIWLSDWTELSNRFFACIVFKVLYK